jgi:proteasome lid subunit RPN8/RPN11
LARPSAKLSAVLEQCWTLVGRRHRRIWYCRCVRPVSGERASVRFDGTWALKREEKAGDIVGFLHTHPDGPAEPSGRDVRTMRAWCSAFGKPLLCLIESPAGMHGYRFDNDASSGTPLEAAERFPGRVIIGVDGDG